jgi:hypothetical protein
MARQPQAVRTINSLKEQIEEKSKEIERLKAEKERISAFLGNERGDSKEQIKKLNIIIGDIQNRIIAKDRKHRIGDKLIRSLIFSRELSKREKELLKAYQEV